MEKERHNTSGYLECDIMGLEENRCSLVETNFFVEKKISKNPVWHGNLNTQEKKIQSKIMQLTMKPGKDKLNIDGYGSNMNKRREK